MRKILLIILVVVAAGALSYHFPIFTPSDSQPEVIGEVSTVPEEYPDERQYILDRVNIERINKGLEPLQRNEKLDAAAKAKAEAMIELDFFAHNDPDGSEPWHYVVEAGYKYRSSGENLSIYFTPEEAVEAWFASPSHYTNIVKRVYRDTGIWIQGDYIVQFFGRER